MLRLILVLLLSLFIKSQEYLEYSHPFHPTVSDKGMVVSQNYIASDIGAEILSKGGNAVDAAVAVGFALTATLPRAGNIGGGGFMLIYDAKNKTIVSLDFRSMSPELATPDVYKAIAVPGTVDGLFTAHELYGSMDMKDLIQPTIDLCIEGIPLTNDLYGAIQNTKTLTRDKESTRVYLDENLKVGGKIKLLDLAKTLIKIRDEGKAGFYDGEIADKIEKAMIENGGLIRKSDLKRYKTHIAQPISIEYRDKSIFAQGPPSGGGVVILTALQILKNFDYSDLKPNSAQYLHILAESLKHGHQNRSKFIGDPKFYSAPLKDMLSDDNGNRRAKEIDFKKTTSSDRINRVTRSIESKYKESEDTTHYSIVDDSGNAVSVTYTLGYSFGSGVTIPGTGILTNSQMNNFASNYGLEKSISRSTSEANKLEPFKRPMSTMSPVMVFDENGSLELITGSPGGSKIPAINLQVLINVIDFDLDIGLATMMPRIHQDWPYYSLQVEKTLNNDTKRMLETYGHKPKESKTMGSTQSIHIKDGVNFGFADLRRPDAKVSVQK
jgi:gamma-glutamyltranspeptidase/glutathione hydrolase